MLTFIFDYITEYSKIVAPIPCVEEMLIQNVSLINPKNEQDSTEFTLLVLGI